MLKYFRIPFATAGDRASVPDASDPSGYVSYNVGYGFDYQRDLASDPAAKPIERDKANQLWFDVTTAIGELQSQGVPDYITSALNNGSAYSYAANALLRYSGDIYLSLVGTNTALPSDTTKWALLPTPARIQADTYVAASAGGTVDAITAAFVPAFGALAGAFVRVRLTGANVSTTPTLKLDVLTAKTIVKGANLPLQPGDLPGAGAWAELKYDATLDKFVLLNPAFGAGNAPTVQGAFKNLQLSATGTNATVTASADELVVENNTTGECRVVRAVAFTINSAGSGIGGLDSGTLAADTWYSVWAVFDGTTVAGLLSTSTTAPTLAGAYTYKARIGWIRTDSSGNKYPLSFKQYGRDVVLKLAAGSNVTSMRQFSSGVQSPWTSVSLVNFVPPTASHASVSAWSGFNTASTQMVAGNGAYGNWASGAVTAPLSSSLSAPGAGAAMYQSRDILLETPQTIFVSADNAACGAAIYGWKDNL